MKAILSTRDKNFRELAIRWFANSGPFWEDDRTEIADDLFYFDNTDVTDQGLGEAARKFLSGLSAGTFSFQGAHECVSADPLVVSHGLQEDILDVVPVRNTTDIQDIISQPDDTPDSWLELMEQASNKLKSIIFSTDIQSQLQPYPFHAGIVRRASELLGILNEIATHTERDGSLDARGKELLQMYFVGEKCAFTDESDGNKERFQTEMTFVDPSDPPVQLFCPWHGKIKMQQFRIHFEWPRPRGQVEIKVLYIGPKITKR